ncbi:protein MMS22-like [Scaptodrosophila lebanonensis]|uniref:Protein MMS22-like n=1 Tax=Drosophila lebanonensis TaxID=7225 RepID=A0A6J2U069_DROLE|nr:protein MMS22-like [Scaptodrosophila lebanonensis]
MDYDLFQSDDDEDILNAFLAATQTDKQQVNTTVCLPSEQQSAHNEYTAVLPEFNCSGRESRVQDFRNDSFIGLGYGLHELPPCTKLDNLMFGFDPGQLQVRAVMSFLLSDACKNVQKFYSTVVEQQHLRSAQTQIDWYKARQQVTHCYHLLLHDEFMELHWPVLREPVTYLRELLNNILDAGTWRVLYFAEHSKGNECQAPAYHFYHGALEWRMLDLYLILKYEVHGQELQEAQQIFYDQLERTLDELILCASYFHHSKHKVELLHSSAFVCPCIKEFWMLLQRLLPMWSYQLSTLMPPEEAEFWPLFDRAMYRYKTQLDSSKDLACHEFHAWLRLSLVRLSAQWKQEESIPSSEVLQIAACLKEFLNCQPDEQQRRVYLCLLAPLQLQFGRPNSDVLCHIWEHMHRSINCSLTIVGSRMQELPKTCASGSAYLERYRKLLGKQQLDDLNLGSFTLFVLLLGKSLQLLGHSNQVQKVLGRIFSKFSAAKMLALNEQGIHQVIELFLSLLLSYCDFAELAPKLREMMLCMSLDKLPPNRRLVTAKGHMALLLLHVERQVPVDEYVKKLLAQLKKVQNDLDVASVFVAALQPIYKQTCDFSHGEHLLISSWLVHYVEHSEQAAQDRVWETLHLIFERIRELQVPNAGVQDMWQALQDHILPLLRLQYVSSYSTWLPKLSADFCLKDGKLLPGFLHGTPANMAANAQLLLHVLEDQHADKQSGGIILTDAVIIQVWVKSLVLLTPHHEAVIALTPHVQQLSEFQALHIEPSALETREPLCAFFRALDLHVQDNAHVRMQLSNKLHAYVHNFELWLPPERIHAERPELVTRFYSFIAIVIYNCAPLAYVRSKPSCFFHLALSRFLLPTSLQTGTPPKGRLPQMMHKIFPVLLQGIGRLPYKTDAYLGWTLQKLLLHWTPYFRNLTNAKLVSRPYASILQTDVEGQLSQFVLEKLMAQFLVVQQRQAGPNTGLVVTILQQLINGLEDVPSTEQQASGEAQLLTLLKAAHQPLLEHVMFVDENAHSRILVLELYRALISHRIFQRSSTIRDAFAADICTLAKKHMAHCTYFFFQMLFKISELVPALVAPLLPFVKNEAQIVEQKRGPGVDVGIRKCLQKLQQVLQTAMPKN